MEKIFIVLLIALLLVSCGEELKEGEVYAKNFHPAHTDTVMMSSVISTGKSFITTFTPITFYYPDSWSISYKTFNDEKNQWISNTVFVSQKLFNSIQIGSWFKKEEGALNARPKIKQ